MPHLAPAAVAATAVQELVTVSFNALQVTSKSTSSALEHDRHAASYPYMGISPQHETLLPRGDESDRLYNRRQQLQVHEIAIVAGTLSIVAELLAIYWFFMMRRNFRRTLVFMLILGDFWKSLWYMAFSAASFVSYKTVPTESSFCQAGGFMLQTGVLACDLAVFLMSLHMGLQIFPPTRIKWLGDDGLYRVRHWVYGIWLLLPMTMTAFAFINPTIPGGFVYQAAFCTLPYRPYWVRLVLHWVPRYLIIIYIMAVALRIYFHVRGEFKLFAEGAEIVSSISSRQPSRHQIDVASASRTNPNVRLSRPSMSSRRQSDESVAPDEQVRRPAPARTQSGPQRIENRYSVSAGNSPRRLSVPSWTIPSPAGDPVAEGCKSDPASRRTSRQYSNDALPHDFTAIDFTRRGSTATFGSVSFASSAFDGGALAPIAEGNHDILESQVSSKVRSGETALSARRRAIQRQLRLLFLYPVVYVLMWTVPFANHCLFYSNHFLQHPVYAVGAITIFCQTLLGFVDVCVFCSREQPWRHIPGSDGTFLGSFKIWRFSRTEAWHKHRRMSSVRSASIPNEKGREVRKKSSSARLVGGLRNLSSSRNDSVRPSLSAGPASPSRPGSLSRMNTTPAAVHRRVTSGGSDRKRAETDLAYERLALERQEFEQSRKSWEPRRSSVLGSHRSSTGSKNWFDRKFSEDFVGDADPIHEDKSKPTQRRDQTKQEPVEEEGPDEDDGASVKETGDFDVGKP